MFGSVKKMISGRRQPSSPTTCPQRRPPSTPPLPLRTLQLVAKKLETPVVLRNHKKFKGHTSGVRESWPGARLRPTTSEPKPRKSQRPLTTPSQPITEVVTPPRGRGSEATMMSLLLFCHSSSSNSLIAIDNNIEQAM
ncbi:hypothetical protein L3Q82_016376, partial [Scortum barcoo]